MSQLYESAHGTQLLPSPHSASPASPASSRCPGCLPAPGSVLCREAPWAPPWPHVAKGTEASPGSRCAPPPVPTQTRETKSREDRKTILRPTRAGTVPAVGLGPTEPELSLCLASPPFSALLMEGYPGPGPHKSLLLPWNEEPESQAWAGLWDPFECRSLPVDAPSGLARMKDTCGCFQPRMRRGWNCETQGEGLGSLFSGRGQRGVELDPAQPSEPCFLIQEMGILQVIVTQKFP